MAKSRLKPPAERAPLDRYDTPMGLVTAIARMFSPRVVIDPCCGDGRFARAFPTAKVAIGVDIDPAAQADAHFDWLDKSAYAATMSAVASAVGATSLAPDLIVGNPPYNLAEEFVTTSLQRLAPDGKLVLVLRTTWRGSKKRQDALVRGALRPSYSLRILPRPSFTGDGKTDGSEYDLVVWDKTFAPKEDYLVWSGSGAADDAQEGNR